MNRTTLHRRFKARIGAVLGSVALVMSLAAHGASDTQTNYVAPAPEVSVSAKQAAKAARAEVKGRVLAVKATPKGYRVRILSSEGRVVTLLVDGKGRVKRGS